MTIAYQPICSSERLHGRLVQKQKYPGPTGSPQVTALSEGKKISEWRERRNHRLRALLGSTVQCTRVRASEKITDRIYR